MPAPTAARARLRAVLLIALVLGLVLLMPARARAGSYVALGDSYSSGVGTRTYYAEAGGCSRSPLAYPALIASRLGASLFFAACSGARTEDVLVDQLAALSAETSYVTISVGGNDAGFSGVITQCALPWPWSCTRSVAAALSYIRGTLPALLDRVYSAIRSRAPHARVAVVGYPRLFNGEDCDAATFLSPAEEAKLDQGADLLASVESERAAAYGFRFVDPRNVFTGHGVCDDAEWLNGLTYPISDSFHPNPAGQRDGYAPLVYAALR
jgi:lysophospholipase L1-like esterase